jgi:hypothetical protein
MLRSSQAEILKPIQVRLAKSVGGLHVKGQLQRGRLQQDRQRGGSRMNLVLTLAVLGAMVLTAVKIVPPYFANYQFQDSLETESRFAIVGYPKKSAEDIRDDVWNKAKELEIPLADKADIKITIDRANVNIATDYTVPVDLIVYHFNLEFHPHADNHTL